ncbi:hypothetical protein FRC01_006052 [Tulasnella sp. 417]|nr:hypothetical protein FRC01_006052 [Tulasnella sp. 417]
MEISSSGCEAQSDGGTQAGRGVWSTTPSPQLPTELLAEIFRSSLPSAELTLNRVEARLLSYMRKLYKMRLVAKRWQEIIDGTPTFWTFVLSILPPDVNETTILRSRNGFLAIVYAFAPREGGYLSAKDFFKSCAHIFPRWSAYRGPLLSEYLEKPAPQLETIIVMRNNGHDEPLELLGGCATSVRHVDPSYVSIRWKAGLFTKLKVLKLVKVGHNPQELNTTLLLDILLASPFLEQLEFSRMDVITDTSSSYPIITLPRLRSICFYDCPYTFTGGILRQIRASSCTNFRLTVRMDGLDLPRLMDDLRPFQEVFREINRRNQLSGIKLNLNAFEWSSGGLGSENYSLFSVHIYGNLPATCIRWVGHILQSEPGLSIRFELGANVSRDVFESMASMRCVTRVEIVAIWREDEVLSVLRFIGDPFSAGSSLPSLPCLREIIFDGTFWNLQTLLDMVHPRFNSLSWEHAERALLRVSVIRRAVSGRIIDLTTLTKLREMDGVESVQLLGPEQPDGCLAITWDEETSKPVRG